MYSLRPWIRWLIALSLAASAPSSALGAELAVRFFFDTNGTAEQQDRGLGNLAFTNPEVADSGRLYLYGQFLNHFNEYWNHISLDIEVTGGGRITAWNIYNHRLPEGRYRWGAVANKSGTGSITLLDDVRMLTATAPAEPGMFWPNADARDPLHFRNHQDDIGNTLLGYIDVDANDSPYSEIRLGVGAGGIASREGGTWDVAFGFGDENAGIDNGDIGAQSPLADATITPEPATLTLLAIASGCAAAGRRWRR
ncbi:MAG: hypothetical protein CHACPFDD_02568 [Phycisphaerae bacterium]|nr:hypothetical protein [Phycisphaerae bacterium]